MKKNIKQLNSKNIKEIIDNYPTRYKEGFMGAEINSFLEEYNLDKEKFYEKLGINTVMVIGGETITYHCDIATALFCLIENRDKHLWEWD